MKSTIILYISLAIIIILLMTIYMLLRYAYTCTFRTLSIDVNTPLQLLIEPIVDIALVHRHFCIAPFWHTNRVSHWVLVCNTKNAHLMISRHNFRNLQICKCKKVNDTYIDDKYRTPMKIIKHYTPRNPVTTEQVATSILKFIQSRKGSYNLFTNNCHHAAIYGIKTYCTYDKNDPFMQHVAGFNLLKTGIHEIASGNIYNSYPDNLLNSNDKELTTMEKILLT